MLDRRELFSTLGRPWVSPRGHVFDPVRARAAVRELAGTPGDADHLAADEAYWSVVQRAFAVDRSMINLNNGGVSPSPAVVLDAMRRYQEFSNHAPAVHDVARPRAAAARRCGRRWRACSAAMPRRSRSPATPRRGCRRAARLRPRARRRGAHHHPGLPADDDHLQADGAPQAGGAQAVQDSDAARPNPADVVRRFAANITDRTRLILISHMVFLTGQVMPVREVVRLGGSAASRWWSTARTRSRTSRSRWPTSNATTSAPACTSGSSRRTAPGCCSCAVSASAVSGR